jgi:hypothetical protein
VTSAPPPDSSIIPLGATLFSDDFETTVLPGGWTDGYDPNRHAITTSIAHTGTHSLRVTFLVGSDGGWLTHFFMPGYDDAVYVRYYILAPNFQVGTKMLRFTGARTDDKWSASGHAGECPNGTDRFIMGINGDLTNNLRNIVFYSYNPDMPHDPNGQCWGQEQGPNITYNPPTGKPGQWRKVEFLVKLNTPGLYNGVAQAWVDGQQVGIWTNLSLRKSTILKLNALMMTFSQVPAASVTEQLYIDDVLIALPAG